MPKLLALFFLSPLLPAQTTWYVDVNGTPPGTGTMSDPYVSIAYAHGQATTVNGDTLRVRPGTYVGNLTLTKQITVASTQGPDVTFLVPAAAGPVLTLWAPFDDSDKLNVKGFTITGVFGAAGTAAVSSGEGSLWDCVIRGNRGNSYRGVQTYYDTLLYDCTVVDNDKGVECNSMGEALWMRNTVVWGNSLNMEVSLQPIFVSISHCAGGPFPFASGSSNHVGDPGLWDLAHGDYRPRPGSVCIDAGHPSYFDTDGSRSDIGHYDYSAMYAPLASYCTGKLNSDGCVPQIAGSGLASATSASPFLVTGQLMLAGKTSLLLYGYAEGALPFQGATLCIGGSLHRAGLQISGGTGPCGGTTGFDFNPRIQSGVDPGLVPGMLVFAQWYQRDPLDPAGFASGLTDGLRFGIVP